MKNFFLFLLLFFAASSHTFAHGENQPGPHGGIIRMPGAFHIELLPKKHGFEIWLLDINFEQPTTENSSVKAMIKADKNSVALKCKTLTGRFFCAADKQMIQQAGTLHIHAIRENQQGAEMSYSLPLNPNNE